MMHSLEAWQVSNVVWSSANHGFNPDEYVPGMVCTLTTAFLHHIMHEANKGAYPNAQDAACLT